MTHAIRADRETRVYDMLNRLSSMNNAGADCKSLYAPAEG